MCSKTTFRRTTSFAGLLCLEFLACSQVQAALDTDHRLGLQSRATRGTYSSVIRRGLFALICRGSRFVPPVGWEGGIGRHRQDVSALTTAKPFASMLVANVKSLATRTTENHSHRSCPNRGGTGATLDAALAIDCRRTRRPRHDLNGLAVRAMVAVQGPATPGNPPKRHAPEFS